MTPGISGTLNGNALQGLWNAGIRAIVGDNSVSYTVPTNMYHLKITTQAESHFAGMKILPRYARCADAGGRGWLRGLPLSVRRWPNGDRGGGGA